VACDAAGRPVIAWLEGRGTAHRIAALDDGAETVWSCELPGLTEDAALVGGPDGALILAADPGANRLHVIDGRSGRLLHRIEGAAPSEGGGSPSSPRPMCLQGNRGVAVDRDGSVVVLAHGPGCREPVLGRFAADGTPQPLWGKRRRNRRSSVISLLIGPEEQWEPPPWDELGDRLAVPPGNARMTIGGDGLLYLVSPDLRRLAAWERDGSLRGVRELEPAVAVFDIDRLAADRGGVLYASTHLDVADGPYAHVIRIAPEGEPELWLGPLSDNPAPLGASDRFLAIGPDDSLCVGGGRSSLRVFDDTGLLRWRSPATEREDTDDPHL